MWMDLIYILGQLSSIQIDYTDVLICNIFSYKFIKELNDYYIAKC